MTATRTRPPGIKLALDPGPEPLTAPRRAKTVTTSTPMVVEVGPRNAYSDPATGLRFYRWQGKDYPSVTSVRRLAGVPFALVNWQLTQVIDHTLSHWSDLNARLASKDPGQLALIRHELRAASTAERDAKAKLGTAVHDAAAEGKGLTEVPADVAQRLRWYLDWLAVSGAEVLVSEQQVWNLTVGYAGTFDLICRFPSGAVYLVDLKTSKSTYPEHVTQCLAYARAEFVGKDDIVDEAATALLRQVTGIAILHLTEDHWEFRRVVADEEAWRAFRGLLAFATWTAAHPAIDGLTIGVKRGEAAA